ncbi:MAG: nitroreductase family protein [Anaerolineales bacterium]|nr:nitroreductase family protein [Anaerolineales bacterium]
MDYQHFLRSRRSIRRFKPEPVPASLLETLLTTAIHAPSAHNLQPWRFVVMQSPQSREQLANGIAERYQYDMQKEGAPEEDIQGRVDRTHRRIQDAPVVILLCRDIIDVKQSPSLRGQQAETTLATQSVALAGLQLLQAAHAAGLSGAWVCWPLFTGHKIQTVLKLPRSWEPQAMFFIGYADEEPQPKDLKSIDQVVKYL